VPAQLPHGLDGSLNGVAAVAPDDVWAVGTALRVTGAETLVLHWNGSRWTRLSLGPTTRPDVVLTGVAASGPSDVWAVGILRPTQDLSQTARVWGIHFDGASWSRPDDFRFRPYRGSGLQAVAAIPGEAIAGGWAITFGVKGVWAAKVGDSPWTFSQRLRGPRIKTGVPCNLPDLPAPIVPRHGCAGLLGVAIRGDGAALGVGESWQGAYAAFMAVPGTFPVDAAPPLDASSRLLGAAACPGASAPFLAAGSIFASEAGAKRALVLAYDGTWAEQPLDPDIADRASTLRGVAVSPDGAGFAVGGVNLGGGEQRTLVLQQPSPCAGTRN
jgi:hypothetical protein